MRQVYEMLRHPGQAVLGALTLMIYQETHTVIMTCGSKCYILLLRTMLSLMIYQKTLTATITCGSKCYILLRRTMLRFDDYRAWTVLVQTYKSISGGRGV